jgi:hypothetical protein
LLRCLRPPSVWTRWNLSADRLDAEVAERFLVGRLACVLTAMRTPPMRNERHLSDVD